MSVSINRRQVLAMSSAGLLPGMFTVPRAQPAGTPEGAWSFTDDHGTTVTLPKRPERIVAYVGSAATLWDYGIEPVGVFGPLRKEDGSPNVLAGNIDVEAVTSVGEGWADVDLEELVALKPDLIVGTTYSPDVEGDLWGLDPDVAVQITQIAPAIAISTFETPVDASLARFEELAIALGADIDAPALVAARERFEAASAGVAAAAAEKPNLSILVASAWPEALYVANLPAASDLLYFQNLGVNFVMPADPDSYWEELSWEQALTYPADLILLDERDGGFTAATVAGAPETFTAHPAVRAGQVANWYTEFVLSYDAFAAILDELAGVLRDSRADVVS